RGPDATSNGSPAATSKPHGAMPPPAGPVANRNTALSESGVRVTRPSGAPDDENQLNVHGTSNAAIATTAASAATATRPAKRVPPTSGTATRNAAATIGANSNAAG